MAHYIDVAAHYGDVVAHNLDVAVHYGDVMVHGWICGSSSAALKTDRILHLGENYCTCSHRTGGKRRKLVINSKIPRLPVSNEKLDK